MADRFWVGGTATWDATAGTKWATTSGGGGGAATPTSADDVFFDAASGAAVVTLSASSVARSINCTGFTGTISHPAGVTVNIGSSTPGAGNIALKFVAGMTYTVGNTQSSRFDFTSTSPTLQTITTGGKVMGTTEYVGVGGSWQLADAYTATVGDITQTNGTLDTNGQTLSFGRFNSNSNNPRTLTLGASSITLTGGPAWDITSATGMTFNAGTSLITCSGTSIIFNGGGLAYFDVSITGSGTAVVSGANTFHNFNRTGTAVVGDGLSISNGFTVSNILTLAGNSNINRLGVFSTTDGTAMTVTTNGSFSLNNVTFRDITAAGAAGTWTGTVMGNGLGNTNITFDAARTLFWVGNSGSWNTTTHWSTSSGGASGSIPPLAQDTVRINAASITIASQTITVNETGLGADIDFTGVLNTPTVNFNTAANIYGSITLVSGLTMGAGGGALTFRGRSSHTITSAGKTWNNSITLTAPGGTYTLQDDFTAGVTRGLTISNGTFDANNKNVSFGTYNSNTAGPVRTINMGSGTWTASGTGNVWSMLSTLSAGLTMNAQTSTLTITDTSSTNKNVATGGRTYNNIVIPGGGTGVIVWSGSPTIASFTISGPKTMTFTANTISTITNLTANGSAGNIISFASATPGTLYKFVIGAPTNVSFCSFQDMNANDSASIWAVNNCTNVSNNHNVIFFQPKRLSVGGVG